MNYWQRCKLLLALIGISSSLYAQNSDLSPANWNAQWVTMSSTQSADYGVYLFRKQFDLTNYSGPFIIHCTADNHYRLYVNGKLAGMGPARFDLSNWYYETIDIGPLLKYGSNTLAVEVLYYGPYKPRAQFTKAMGLLVQGHTDKEAAIINTGSTPWKVTTNEGIDVWPVKSSAFYGAFPGDSITAQFHPWGWEQASYKDTDWEIATPTASIALQGKSALDWRLLTPRTINPLTLEKQRFIGVKDAHNLEIGKSFLAGVEPLNIPAKQKVSLLFDAGYQTTGLPELQLSGGLDADINITYIPEYSGGTKLQDHISPDGAARRTFQPSGYRTFRYIRLDIATSKSPLTLIDYTNNYLQQQLTDKSAFTASATLDTLWKVAKQIAFTGAQDFLIEDAYNEQLQYIQGARIHGLAIAAITGDLQLLKQAIWQAAQSRIPEGLIRDRYPADDRIISVSSSLQWIGSIQDYLMLKNDKVFAKQLYPGVKQLLNWFEENQDPQTGLATANMPYRNDVPVAKLTYQYIYALRQAAQIAGYCDAPVDSLSYSKTADKLREQLYQQCYDQSKSLFADAPGKSSFSRSTTALAVLGQAVPPKQVKNVMQRVLNEKAGSNETFWEKYFIFKAMQESGVTDEYAEELRLFLAMYEQKLPAFYKSSVALANLYLLGITAGIQSTSYGFKTVLIAPDPGKQPQVKATMAHPDGGTISVDLQFTNNRVKGKVSLPFGVTGKFRWRGKDITLHGGPQEVSL
ncbi:hypothetical protein DVR12_13165 [Chitinophaga silvatica]|uniref:Alpha-L-rhamnosidase n=1 Tax=Chitinophaga silvatica TaxID=2282649 RepID=A0A3E1YAP6_9BACT|nr:alpha-L-rhamnosidase N-terminal domain-containing protein [Chitinophaga silvatica]RFS22738.1 hypothetical protein DVR12_13165 [Chitinophaga silvatica]